MAFARLLRTGLLFHAKDMSRSSFFWFASVFMPVIYASVAFLMLDAGRRGGSQLSVALGAGMMGVWMTTLFGSGTAIQSQRWRGTLELLVAAPAPFLLTLIPLTVATAAIGIYSVAATLLCGWALFGMPLQLAHPLLFALALPLTLVSLGLLGLVLACSFVLYRQALAFASVLDYPVWLASGLLVPLSLLPGWVEPISWALAPTWGIKAIRAAALGGDVAAPLAACAALGLAYLALGALLSVNFERLARSRATLALT